MNQLLTLKSSLRILEKIKASGLPYTYNYPKHRIEILNEAGKEIIFFRLPITLPPPDKLADWDETPINYVILLIQSGASALGYFEGEDNLDHKVYKSYMVRKKQGKSQIKYMKTRGKSKAGSRVRLANGLLFFENINERLNEYFDDYEIDRIAISCSKILLPYLYNSKVSCPFDKKESRLYKIPKHLHLPKYEILLEMQQYLGQGEFVFEEEWREVVEGLLVEENL